MAASQQAAKCLHTGDDCAVKVPGSSHTREHRTDTVWSDCRAIGAILGHRLKDVSYCHDSCLYGDLAAVPMKRIAIAGNRFMMERSPLGDLVKGPDTPQNLPGLKCMPLDYSQLCFVERSGFVEHLVRNAELANVVQEPGDFQQFAVPGGQSGEPSKKARQTGNSDRVFSCECTFIVYNPGEDLGQSHELGTRQFTAVGKMYGGFIDLPLKMVPCIECLSCAKKRRSLIKFISFAIFLQKLTPISQLANTDFLITVAILKE